MITLLIVASIFLAWSLVLGALGLTRPNRFLRDYYGDEIMALAIACAVTASVLGFVVAFMA